MQNTTDQRSRSFAGVSLRTQMARASEPETSPGPQPDDRHLEEARCAEWSFWANPKALSDDEVERQQQVDEELAAYAEAVHHRRLAEAMVDAELLEMIDESDDAIAEACRARLRGEGEKAEQPHKWASELRASITARRNMLAHGLVSRASHAHARARELSDAAKAKAKAADILVPWRQGKSAICLAYVRSYVEISTKLGRASSGSTYRECFGDRSERAGPSPKTDWWCAATDVHKSAKENRDDLHRKLSCFAYTSDAADLNLARSGALQAGISPWCAPSPARTISATASSAGFRPPSSSAEIERAKYLAANEAADTLVWECSFDQIEAWLYQDMASAFEMLELCNQLAVTDQGARENPGDAKRKAAVSAVVQRVRRCIWRTAPPPPRYVLRLPAPALRDHDAAISGAHSRRAA